MGTIDLSSFNRGDAITITFTDGTTFAGSFISVNTKGINFRTTDGIAVSRALSRVDRVDNYTQVQPDKPADMFNDGDTYTAAQLAAMLDILAKDLRKTLRANGLNVGKGRRYEFTADQARRVVDMVNADQA